MPEEQEVDMRVIALIAVLLVVLVQMRTSEPNSSVLPAVVVTNDASGARTVSIKEIGNEFSVFGVLNGQVTKFKIDTGATAVFLTRSTARNSGILIAEDAFRTPVATANGIAYYASARIRELKIGGIVVRDKEVFVSRDAALSSNLLGVTFLKTLKRFEYSRGVLVLEQ